MPKICESVKGYTIMLMYSLGYSKDVYFPVLSLINFSQSIGSSLNGTLSTPGSGSVFHSYLWLLIQIRDLYQFHTFQIDRNG